MENANNKCFRFTSACKTKVMPKLLQKMSPWRLEKKTKETPNATKKYPREPPRPEMQPEKSRKGLQEGAWDPRGAPEARQAIFGCSKAVFGSPLETPLGKQWRRANSVIWYESATLATKMAHWKTKDFWNIFNENMQKPLFFQCKTAFDARAETPPGGAINAPCGHQMLLFDMNQLHSPNWKTRAQKSDKNEKTFLKKWVWRQLHTLGLPGAASWRKGCQNEHNALAKTTVFKSEHFVSTRSALLKLLL